MAELNEPNLFQRVGAFFSGGGDALSKQRAEATPPSPPTTATQQPEAFDDTMRPNVGPGSFMYFQQPSGKMMRTQSGRASMTAFTKEMLSKTDPVTAAIVNKYKSMITMLEFSVTPDLDKEKVELVAWEKQAIYQLSPSADPTVFGPKYENRFLPNDIANPLRTALKKVAPGPDARKRVRWLLDRALIEMRDAKMSLAETAESKIRNLNTDTIDPFRVSLEKTIEDLCVHDGHGLAAVRTRGGDFFEGYDVPGSQVVIYRNPDWTTPKPPERAFAWEISNKNICEYSSADFIWMVANPQVNGYGFSPLEMAAYVITATLQADAYNIDSFKSNIPPAIVNLGKMAPEQRERFKFYWDQEVKGKVGGMHKIMFTNLEKDTLDKVDLVGLKQKDMEMYKYIKFCLIIKCMCFGITPQDIGFTEDMKYETSRTAQKITAGGVADMVHLLENYYTLGLLQQFMGYQGLKFKFKNDDGPTSKEQEDMLDQAVKGGRMTINQALEEKGQRPLTEGGDVPFIVLGSTVLPISQIRDDMDPMMPSATEDPGSSPKDEKPAGKKPAPGAKDVVEDEEDPVEKAMEELILAKAGTTRLSRLKESRNKRNSLLSGFKKAIRQGVKAANKSVEKHIQNIKE